jgi:hypothetical protein
LLSKLYIDNIFENVVPSANKRDQRSIEQILADNRKKKLKTEDEK